MKKISIKSLLVMVLAMMSASLTACHDEYDNNDPGLGGSAQFALSTSAIQFAKTGGTTYLYVQSASQPTVVSNADWLTVQPLENESPRVYKYLVTAATTTETNDRQATISINDATVNVSQTAAEGLVVTSAKTIEMDADGGAFAVSLQANADYTVAIDNGWIAEVQTRANMQSYTHQFSVMTNLSEAREGTVSFTLAYDDSLAIVESVIVKQEQGTMNGDMTKTAMQVAKLMYPGWNLGNTMEGGNNADLFANAGIGTETAWQGTTTTKAIIDLVAAQGFKSVRIPTAWVMGHITDASQVTIDPAWMARVKQIVDYCIADGLYVVLNDHWDGGWLENSFGDVSDATVEANAAKLQVLWTQIANEFKDYDAHLLFAGLNEPDCTYGSTAQVNALLKYHQAFIDAVRATGGKNAGRVLIVQGPQTNISSTYEYFDVTKLNDAVADRLMVEVHYYDPPQFTGVWENGAPLYFWGAANHVGGSSYNATSAEESYILSQFNKMKSKFTDKGYPVLLGEFGANWRKLDANQAEHDASVKLFHQKVTEYAINSGMVPMVWDINVPNQQGASGIMTIINRTALNVFGTPAMEGITEGAKAGVWPN